ncbi:hypothetical protein ACDT12_13545 [Staphylococcus aureus]
MNLSTGAALIDLLEVYKGFVEKYPVVSIEDAFDRSKP